MSHSEDTIPVRLVWLHQLQMNRTYTIVPAKKTNLTGTILLATCMTMQGWWYTRNAWQRKAGGEHENAVKIQIGTWSKRATQATKLIISMRSTQVKEINKYAVYASITCSLRREWIWTNMRSSQSKHVVYASNEIEQICGLRKQNMRSTQVMNLNKNAVYARKTCGLRK